MCCHKPPKTKQQSSKHDMFDNSLFPKSLAKFLSITSICKVGVGISKDVLQITHAFHVPVSESLCLHKLASRLGIAGSLMALSQNYCGIVLSKNKRFPVGHWWDAPLSMFDKSVIEYAALDAHASLMVYRSMVVSPPKFIKVERPHNPFHNEESKEHILKEAQDAMAPLVEDKSNSLLEAVRESVGTDPVTLHNFELIIAANLKTSKTSSKSRASRAAMIVAQWIDWNWIKMDSNGIVSIQSTHLPAMQQSALQEPLKVSPTNVEQCASSIFYASNASQQNTEDPLHIQTTLKIEYGVCGSDIRKFYVTLKTNSSQNIRSMATLVDDLKQLIILNFTKRELEMATQDVTQCAELIMQYWRTSKSILVLDKDQTKVIFITRVSREEVVSERVLSHVSQEVQPPSHRHYPNRIDAMFFDMAESKSLLYKVNKTLKMYPNEMHRRWLEKYMLLNCGVARGEKKKVRIKLVQRLIRHWIRKGVLSETKNGAVHPGL